MKKCRQIPADYGVKYYDHNFFFKPLNMKNAFTKNFDHSRIESERLMQSSGSYMRAIYHERNISFVTNYRRSGVEQPSYHIIWASN